MAREGEGVTESAGEIAPDLAEAQAEHAKARTAHLTGMMDGFIARMSRPAAEKIARSLPMLAQSSNPGESCCLKTVETEAEDTPYEVLWNGVFQGLSGYSKASREIVLRLANTFRVRIEHSIRCGGAHTLYDEARFGLHEKVKVSPSAPMVRFFGPWDEDKKRRTHRINYTMMETELIHPTMIGLMNDSYDEVWTPTQWNAEAFAKSGLKLPLRVMPLGVNPWLYRPGPREPLPKAELLSTGNHGAIERPYGFVFLCVFLPSFRKGIDILVEAFEQAFGNDPEASLVLGITHAGSSTPLLMPTGTYRSRIYALRGEFTEREMARLYRGSDAYISTSRGEGWNLPMTEAAATGLPIIAPRASSHPEIVDEQAWLFSPEGLDFYRGAEAVSPWYEGMPFPVYGPKTIEQIVHFLRTVKCGGTGVQEKAIALRKRILSTYTWDRSAARISDRLAELVS